MQRVIAISVAHDAEGGDPGAIAPDGTTEASLSEQLSKLVVAELGPAGVLITGSLKSAIAEVNAMPNVAGAVEFHFDKGGHRIGRTAVALITPKAFSVDRTSRDVDSHTLADNLAYYASASHPWMALICPAWPPFTAHTRLGWCEDVHAPSVLYEVGYLDNPVHLAWLQKTENMQALARSFARGLRNFLEGKGDK